MSERPFGHSAIVVLWRDHQFVEKQIHAKGPRKRIERSARLMSGFQRIESIDAYTREQYVRVFGEGSEHGARR